METLPIALLLATLLSALVAGFAFAFAAVAMPGLGSLDDRDFLRAFQAIDGVIQRNQPIFMAVWVGSMVALAASAVLGIRQLHGADRWLLVVAALVYFAGVQLPTMTINVPLNNQLQQLDVQVADETELAEARAAFEPRWNRWNVIRTLLAIVTSALLLVLVLRLPPHF